MRAHEKKTCGWDGNKTPRRRSGRSRHAQTRAHKRAHKRILKGERERIRTRRKRNMGTKERERRREKELKERNKERVLLVILTISFVFFDVYWVSRGKDFGVFSRQIMHSRNFGRTMKHSRNFGRLFFFLFLCCVPAPTRIISSCLFCFDFLRWWRKKKSKRGREKNRRSVICSLFFKRNDCMYAKRYKYPICFLNWTTTS